MRPSLSKNDVAFCCGLIGVPDRRRSRALVDVRIDGRARLADDASVRALLPSDKSMFGVMNDFRRIGTYIAIGNSGDASLAPAAERLLDDSSPLVRGMAVWALRRLLDAGAFARLKLARAPREQDASVAEEWDT